MNQQIDDRWLDLCNGLAIDGALAREWHARLVEAYGASDRHYHNLSHIDHCLREFDLLRDQAQNASAIAFAIWFHDFVYDSHAANNEAKSADIAREMLVANDIDRSFINAVTDLILVTRHDVQPEGIDAKIIVDADLSILGHPWGTFDQYERNIRAEYEWVDDASFTKGRAAVLNSFLDRSTIFSTELFVDRYEQPARENIRTSLQQLNH